MIPGRYDHRNCTATNCSNCYSFSITATIGVNTWTTDHLDDFRRALEELPNKIELARRRARQIHEMAPRLIESAPVPVAALNAGMHLRRMRASAGLARGRIA